MGPPEELRECVRELAPMRASRIIGVIEALHDAGLIVYPNELAEMKMLEAATDERVMAHRAEIVKLAKESDFFNRCHARACEREANLVEAFMRKAAEGDWRSCLDLVADFANNQDMVQDGDAELYERAVACLSPRVSIEDPKQ